MKKLITLAILLFMMTTVLFTSCGKDDENPLEKTGNSFSLSIDGKKYGGKISTNGLDPTNEEARMITATSEEVFWGVTLDEAFFKAGAELNISLEDTDGNAEVQAFATGFIDLNKDGTKVWLVAATGTIKVVDKYKIEIDATCYRTSDIGFEGPNQGAPSYHLVGHITSKLLW